MTEMFEGYFVPDKVQFYDFVQNHQDWLKDSWFTCEALCNVENGNNGWDYDRDSKCFGISCCKCVF